MKNTTIIALISIVVFLVAILAVRVNGNQMMTSYDDMPHADLVVDDHHMDDDDHTEAYEIYPGDVADKMQNKEDVVLLDVRTLEEYEEVHLENALLLPVEELSQQTLAAIGLGSDKKDEEIIIYCRSGARSKIAYDVMKSLGYTNIKSSAGGMIHWQEDNYPFTESGSYSGLSWGNQKDSDTSNAVTSGSKISIADPFYDFGVIPQSGGTVSKDFVVKNAGSEILEIGTLTTSCSCTSASISESSIDLGDSAVLTVVFDPDFHEEPTGVFKRTVFIPNNDPGTPEAEVVIQVDIAEEN